MSFTWKNDQTLRSILSKELTVPNHQRDYAWSSEEAGDLVSDLDYFMKNRCNEDNYLFGQFIFFDDKKTTMIIDGQQRLVTSIIFISIIREKVERIKPDDLEGHSCLISKIVETIGSKSKGLFHFTIKGNAKPYFEKHILKGEPIQTSGRYTATKNIKAVYDVIKSYLEYIDDMDDNEAYDELDKITTCLLEQFRVSSVTTNDLSEAYTIFETLNSRGKDLEAADLLKNYCIVKAGESVVDVWNVIETKIDEAKDSITGFIRYVWNSQHKLVSKRAVYRAISKSLNTESKVNAFIQDINDLCPYYLSLSKPENYNEFNDKKIKERLLGLSDLELRIYYPIILSCVRIGTDNKMILKIIESIESLVVRNIIIGSHNANEYESSFCDLATEISTKTKTPDQALLDIKSKIDPDEIFSIHFKTATISKTKTARYILSEIYNYENGKELRINRDPSEVNCEHIMPEKIDKWDVPQLVHEQYLNYIGNLTLLLSSDNTSISNDTFDVKKITYSRSSLKQNNEYFTNISEWTAEQILTRQEVLMKTALERWKK